MRDISTIANDIRKEWKNPYFGAVPYLNAMACLHSADDAYGADSARTIVAYFLGNASTFRGEQARKLKAELKECLA
jgi:hypothetical protein